MSSLLHSISYDLMSSHPSSTMGCPIVTDMKQDSVGTSVVRVTLMSYTVGQGTSVFADSRVKSLLNYLTRFVPYMTFNHRRLMSRDTKTCIAHGWMSMRCMLTVQDYRRASCLTCLHHYDMSVVLSKYHPLFNTSRTTMRLQASRWLSLLTIKMYSRVYGWGCLMIRIRSGGSLVSVVTCPPTKDSWLLKHSKMVGLMSSSVVQWQRRKVSH